MNLVVYHAKASHPHHDASIYDRIWPKFLHAAHVLDYRVVQLTSETEVVTHGDVVQRYPIDPAMPMFSREVCWVSYLRDAASDEQHCLIETDFLLRRRIPDLADGFDMMLLDRTGETVQTSIRICKTTALTFYEEVLRIYENDVPVDKRAWYGDCWAHHIALGVPPEGKFTVMPRNWRHLRIEIRDQHDYGNTWPKREDAIAWHFKGTSKTRM